MKKTWKKPYHNNLVNADKMCYKINWETSLIWESSAIVTYGVLFNELSLEFQKIFKKAVYHMLIGNLEIKTRHLDRKFILLIIKKIYDTLNKPGKFELFFDIEDIIIDLIKHFDLIKQSESCYLSEEIIKCCAEIIAEFHINDLKKRGII